MSFATGARLGPYEIVTLIGAGGMGEVYKARDTRLNRIVAIKILYPPTSRPRSRLRLEREAQAIAALAHPHICVLHDIGHHEDCDFLVMEYLEGETLASRLRQGPLPIDQVLRYATEIGDALDKAHRQGIIHRDLKPGNIMLTKGGVKLLDFGLAKCARQKRSVRQRPRRLIRSRRQEAVSARCHTWRRSNSKAHRAMSGRTFLPSALCYTRWPAAGMPSAGTRRRA